MTYTATARAALVTCCAGAYGGSGDARSVQVAGLTNLTGGALRGGQVAGLLNTAGAPSAGTQPASI